MDTVKTQVSRDEIIHSLEPLFGRMAQYIVNKQAGDLKLSQLLSKTDLVNLAEQLHMKVLRDFLVEKDAKRWKKTIIELLPTQ